VPELLSNSEKKQKLTILIQSAISNHSQGRKAKGRKIYSESIDTPLGRLILTLRARSDVDGTHKSLPEASISCQSASEGDVACDYTKATANGKEKERLLSSSN
jgi:hypothetical protein